MAAAQRPAVPLPRAFGRPRPGWRIFGLFMVALLIGVALLQVNQFSRMTSTGYEIEQLKRERSAKQAANHELEAEVASLSSLARVDWEARVRLKMEPARRKLYMQVNTTTPARQTLPTRFLPLDQPAAQAPPQGESHDSVWQRLLKLLPF